MLKSALVFVWEVTKIVIIALLIVLPIRYFIFQPFLVRGSSMEPNFHNGDYLIVDEVSYRVRNPQRGEVIVFKFPGNPSQRYIKRVVGLPGETIKVKDGNVFVYKDGGSNLLDESRYLASVVTPGAVTISLDEDEYFVMGDNRVASSDSRRWGSLSEDYIIGRALIRVLPFTALAQIETPEY